MLRSIAGRPSGVVRNGDVPIAVVLPRNSAQAHRARIRRRRPAIQLLSDVSDPVRPDGPGTAPEGHDDVGADLIIQGGLKQFEQHAGQLTPQQRATVDASLPMLQHEAGTSTGHRWRADRRTQ